MLSHRFRWVHRSLVLALVLALMMVLGSVALADDTNTTVTTAASKNAGEFTITMQSAEANHTFNAYRIFDGSIGTNGKLGDISWATGVNTAAVSGKTIAQELTDAGLATTIGEGADQKTLDLSKAADVAQALALQSDDSDVMKKVADVFYARKGAAVATVSAKTGSDYILGNGAAESGNEPLVAGYYLVTDEYTTTPADAGAATLSRNILAVVGDVTAKVKNTVPEITKKILDPTKVDANEAGIGEIVVYELDSKVPNWAGYDKYFFVINDTLSDGLTFNPASVVVKVGDATLTAGTDYVLYVKGDATNAADSPYTFQIGFKNIKAYAADTAITVTYNAVVNEDAVIGGTGNPNEVDLTYSNNPNESSNGNPSENPKPDATHPTGKTVKDKVITYVAKLDLTKYFDEVKSGNELADATFLLQGTATVPTTTTAEKFVEDNTLGTYYKLADGKYTTTAPILEDIKRSDGSVEVSNNKNDYDQDALNKKFKITTETTYSSETKNIYLTGTSGADGKITFKGLGAGTYTIKEIVTPKGYTTAEDITFTIGVTVPSEVTIDGTHTATWTSNNEKVSVGETTGVYATNIIDLSGTTLPSTGGVGTTIFYVAGSILVLAAAVLLITKRRMGSED